MRGGREVWTSRALFIGYWQSPFFDLHDLHSPPFSIYLIFTVPRFRFTWSSQSLFSIHMIPTGFWQSPFYDLHVIRRIKTMPFFRFTYYLQDLDLLPFFSIYMLFTGSREYHLAFFNVQFLPFSTYIIYMLFNLCIPKIERNIVYCESIFLYICVQLYYVMWHHHLMTWTLKPGFH